MVPFIIKFAPHHLVGTRSLSLKREGNGEGGRERKKERGGEKGGRERGTQSSSDKFPHLVLKTLELGAYKLYFGRDK